MRTKIYASVLMALFLACCSQRSNTPGEAFTTLVLKPLPQEITDLRAFVAPGEKSPAWFRFEASAQALAQVQVALQAWVEKYISSKDNVDFHLYQETFRDAPRELQPPEDLLGTWTMYQGKTKMDTPATMLVKTDGKTGYAGTVFLRLK